MVNCWVFQEEEYLCYSIEIAKAEESMYQNKEDHSESIQFRKLINDHEKLYEYLMLQKSAYYVQNKQVTNDATKLSAAAINYIHYYNNNSYFKILILGRKITKINLAVDI